MDYVEKVLSFLFSASYEFPEISIVEAKKLFLSILSEGDLNLKELGELELSSLKVSLIISSLSKNEFLRNKFAVVLSKFLHKKIIDLEGKELERLANKLGIEVESLWMEVSHYLEYSPNSIDYSLFYKDVFQGKVRVSEHELKRIIQEFIYKKLRSFMKSFNPSVLDAQTLNKIKEAVSFLENEIPKFSKSVEIKKVSSHPPCINKIMKRLKKHENLSHYERWVLAIYLINLGVPIPQINELYKNLPDYKEKITLYQLNHIKEKGYSMPSCSKMRTYGVCVGCDTKNPMEWVYGSKRMDKKKNK